MKYVYVVMCFYARDVFIHFAEKLLSSMLFWRTVCYVPLNAVIAHHVTKRLRFVEPKIGYVFVVD